MEVVADKEQNAAESEQNSGEHHQVILVSIDESGENEVIDNEKNSVFHAVGQNATQHHKLLVITSQWVESAMIDTSEHYRSQ